MAKVTGTSGKLVEFQITGVGEVIRRLRAVNKKVESSADLGVIKAGAFIEDEVKESISGRRAELQSVDTGLLLNSIEFVKTGNAEGKVEPKSKTYIEGGNTQEVATHLEYGTSRISPRRHFRNTEARNANKIRDIIDKEINIGPI